MRCKLKGNCDQDNIHGNFVNRNAVFKKNVTVVLNLTVYSAPNILFFVSFIIMLMGVIKHLVRASNSQSCIQKYVSTYIFTYTGCI